MKPVLCEPAFRPTILGGLITLALLVPTPVQPMGGPPGDGSTALPVDSGFVEVEGGKFFYQATGSGPALIMIHDGLIHSATWDAQFAAFADRYRVIRWDRRGYGRSDPPTAPFSNVDDLLALMKALDIERATLMGCSAGGLLAISFALEHPDRVSALVLVGPIVSGLGFSDHFITRGGRGMPDKDAPVAKQIEYWTGKDPWILAPSSKAAKRKMKKLLTANPQNLTGSAPHARWPKEPALGRLGQIHVPALIVVGEADIPDVHAHVGAIQAGIAGSERVVLTRAGHLVHMEVPEAFNQVVLDFLEAR